MFLIAKISAYFSFSEVEGVFSCSQLVPCVSQTVLDEVAGRESSCEITPARTNSRKQRPTAEGNFSKVE